MLNLAHESTNADTISRREKLACDEQRLHRERSNATQAVLKYGDSPVVAEALAAVDLLDRHIRLQKAALNRSLQAPPELPQSVAELRQLYQQTLAELAPNSHELGQIMRQLVPQFAVYLVRSVDGGHLRPRARVTLALDGISTDLSLVPGVSKLLHRGFTLDLFDPPQREQIRTQVVGLSAQGLGQRQIAQQIVPKPTQTAVFDALELQREMDRLGMPDPYAFVASPPSDYGKLRRHRNAKYRFAPLAGYQPPTL